jgi:hypothetical protein
MYLLGIIPYRQFRILQKPFGYVKKNFSQKSSVRRGAFLALPAGREDFMDYRPK